MVFPWLDTKVTFHRLEMPVPSSRLGSSNCCHATQQKWGWRWDRPGAEIRSRCGKSAQVKPPPYHMLNGLLKEPQGLPLEHKKQANKIPARACIKSHVTKV